MVDSEQQKVRWGLLGTGDIVTKVVAPCIKQLPETELVAACRRDADKLCSFAETFDIPRTYTDIDALLGDPEIDAVYIATPNHLHCEQTIKAAQAGKHVLVEKPMAISAKECKQMISACRQGNVRLGVSYYRRTLAAINEVKRLIDDGAIGQIVLMRTDYGGLIDNLSSEHWLLQKSCGGGSLLGAGCHAIDLMLYFGGDIVSVASSVDNLISSGDADDMAVMVCRFANGAMGMLSSRYNSPSDSFPFEIPGSKGRLSFDAKPAGPLLLFKNGKAEEIEVPPVAVEDLDTELIRSFSHQITSDGPFANPGEKGLRTNVVIDAIFKASQTRSWIDIDWDRELSY